MNGVSVATLINGYNDKDGEITILYGIAQTNIGDSSEIIYQCAKCGKIVANNPTHFKGLLLREDKNIPETNLPAFCLRGELVSGKDLENLGWRCRGKEEGFDWLWHHEGWTQFAIFQDRGNGWWLLKEITPRNPFSEV